MGERTGLTDVNLERTREIALRLVAEATIRMYRRPDAQA
jgi:hypothetical protein